MDLAIIKSIKLDRTRDFSTVHGEIELPITAFQMHRGVRLPFGADGCVLEAALTDAMKKALAKSADKKEKPSEPKSKSKSKDEAKVNAEDDAAEAGEAGEEVNLTEWLRGTIRLEPHVVFSEIRRRFSKNTVSLTDAVEFLVYDQNVLPADQVSERLLPRAAA